jgi:hypothetical protein
VRHGKNLRQPLNGSKSPVPWRWRAACGGCLWHHDRLNQTACGEVATMSIVELPPFVVAVMALAGSPLPAAA